MSPSTNVSSPRTYLAVWFWLAGLMLVSVLVSATSLSKQAIVLLVLILSTVKAALVALYYMHLKVDRRVLAFVAGFPLVLVGLAVLVVYSSRWVKL